MQATTGIMTTECHEIIKIRVIITASVAGGYAGWTLKTTCLFSSLASDKASFGARGTSSFITLLTYQALISQYVLTVDTQGILGPMALMWTRAVTRPLPPTARVRSPRQECPPLLQSQGKRWHSYKNSGFNREEEVPSPWKKLRGNPPGKPDSEAGLACLPLGSLNRNLPKLCLNCFYFMLFPGISKWGNLYS